MLLSRLNILTMLNKCIILWFSISVTTISQKFLNLLHVSFFKFLKVKLIALLVNNAIEIIFLLFVLIHVISTINIFTCGTQVL